MSKLKNITIGSDPELFIVNTTTDKVVSSIGLIPGQKGDAYHPENMPSGFGLQIDNILAEYNIPPVDNEDDFVNNMLTMKEWIRDFVKSKDSKLDILCQGSAFIDEDQLQSDEAKMFGCEPDFNAWLEAENPTPEGAATNLRTTGCHIHVGYDDHNLTTSLLIIKTLDLFLGVPSILMDNDNERRKLYGKAGCFRMTAYGCEYRTLSGYFITSEETLRWVYRQTMKAIAFINEGKTPQADMDAIMECINTNNTDLAKKLINKYNIL